MKKISYLLQHLSSQGFQLSPVRLTLNNYLASLYRDDELLTEEVLHYFIQDCLEFPHWQQHREELSKSLFSVLEEVGEEDLCSLEELREYTQAQIVEIQSDQDIADVVQAYLTHSLKGEFRQFRIFWEGKGKIVAICLLPEGRLRIFQFDRKFVIRNGVLSPLRTSLSLQFDRHLNLDTQVPQKIEIGPYLTARFYHEGENLVRGKVVRGYIFQKFQDLPGVEPEACLRLFLAIKRMEQFFLRRETDPYYQGLIQELERTNQWIRLKEPLDPGQISDLQVRIQNALEYVYNGDRLLALLLKELQVSIHESTGIASSIKKLDREIGNKQENIEKAKLPLWNLKEVKDQTQAQPTAKSKAQTTKFASINSLRNVGFVPDDTQTQSLKKDESQLTEKKSLSSELKSILKRTKLLSMENQ